ncbi:MULTISPECIES: carboxypeptidase-like regulatory domain-containing protein [Sanguibacteroides]|uniref:Uncharacterized protein n=1 Tax=Sanguibacteroides justesenii TaxID=1547597 RepID=A0A0C3NHL5_9PORP|nr:MULTISPECIES: carboxypeptidase-like regulatory domain-containing protein [Sanguibacteroides]KIO43454.1 hypothetical protein IE90_09960 [Sanguibacteroides justesenii]KIO45632.1 hypothetical protein BA92_03980 [Sanguibacteroides justesenii]PXZ45275.1 carboxypeptidase-like regulatory domain-containing protein [Sanguibacteroides justesenii]
MNKRIFLLLVLFFGVFSFVQAQDDDGKIRIKGVVLDEKTREPIAFANLGVLGTVLGVASDIDGQFELIIPERCISHVLKVSAIGYGSKECKVYDVKDKGKVEILLQPTTYGIKTVDVTAESLVFKKLLERAVANIGLNYIPRAYNYEGYFEYGIRVNDGERKSKEAIVKIYDKNGYERSNVEENFLALNYKFTQVRRSEEAVSVADGMIYFDDIISADIVRNTRNILDIENLRDYTLKNKGIILYDGDSVQVIGYECKKPTLSNAGDASVTQYSGEIYIHMKNAAVLKNVMHIRSAGFNRMGRNLLPIEGDSKSNVVTTITTNYKKISSYYFLSGVSMVYSYNEGKDVVKGELQYQTTRVGISNVEAIEGRTYYEDMKTDHDFWNRYTIYLEEEE